MPRFVSHVLCALLLALVVVPSLSLSGVHAEEQIEKLPEAVPPGPDVPAPEPAYYRRSDFRSPFPPILKGTVSDKAMDATKQAQRASRTSQEQIISRMLLN